MANPDDASMSDATSADDAGPPAPPDKLSDTGFFTGMNQDGSIKLADPCRVSPERAMNVVGIAAPPVCARSRSAHWSIAFHKLNCCHSRKCHSASVGRSGR